MTILFYCHILIFAKLNNLHIIYIENTIILFPYANKRTYSGKYPR
jgi:hypothetical protein